MSAGAALHQFLGAGIRVIRQSETAECGLACIAMIGNFHGGEISLPELRRHFPASVHGVSLARLMEIAEAAGLESRAVRLSPAELPQLKLPCILHWKNSHYVVLVKISKRQLDIVDPASGRLSVALAEADSAFTGFALELAPTRALAGRTFSRRLRIRDVVGTIVGVRRAAAYLLAFALGMELCSIAAPFYLQWVFDEALVGMDLDLLSLLALAFGVVLSVHAGLLVARGWGVSWLNGQAAHQWQGNLFRHVLRLPLSFFLKRHVGDLVSRFDSVHTVLRTLTAQGIEVLVDGGMSLLTCAVLFYYWPALACGVLGVLGVYALLRAVTFRHLSALTEQQLSWSAKQQTLLIESIAGIQAVKLANRQLDRLARYRNAAIHSAETATRIQRVSATFAAANFWLFGCMRIVLVWALARRNLGGDLSIGMLVAILAFSEQLTSRAGQLIDKLVDFRNLSVHAQRIADVTTAEAERSDHGGGAAHSDERGIEVQGVSFRYSEQEPWILRDCSFVVRPGESLAIAGVSGCGKTTLAKILLGLLEPTEGAVLVGGRDIRQLGLGAYRDSVGAVMQEDTLFQGSIAENIAFFDADATPARVESAARIAAVHEEIAALPMGYGTVVGHLSSALSGGQRQRVILARALYRQPKILLLDEATSHLDVDKERQVNDVVRSLNITRIIIAHRPETLASADRVLVLTQGRLSCDRTRRRDGTSRLVNLE